MAATRKFEFQVGVALNSRTPIERIAPVVAEIDVVCCPGAWSWEVIGRVKELRRALPPDVQVQVEGVDRENARALVEAGATLLVCGKAIFAHSDRAAAYRQLIDAAG